ncbi:YihY/virulence factor BrkB family protein [bacterium]|nr:YihY/virulence factor BrkB family protein [bacterium]
MIALKDIRKTLKRIYFSDDLSDRKGLRGVIAYVVRYFFHVFKELNRDQCFLRASALTFTTVMTLIPIMVLLFVTFRAFGGLQEASSRVQQFMFQHMLPESVISIQSYIENLVKDFNTQAVSYISLLFLIGSAYTLFASVDSSLNIIWGAHQPRGFFNRLVTIWFILTVTPVLLGYSLYLTARLEDVSVLDNVMIQTGFAAFRWFTPYLLSLVSLTLLYKLVPRTRVFWSSAILGGSFAALFWELTKYGFNYYVQNLANFKVLYGSFLTLPVFLIWVNLSWLLILGGAEVAYTHQNLNHLHLIRKRRESALGDNCLLSDKLGIYIYCLIAEGFLTGTPITRTAILEKAPGQGRASNAVLDRFRDAGVILFDQNDRVVPARDLSQVKINDIFEFFEPEEGEQYFRTSAEISRSADRILNHIRIQRKNTLENLSFYSISGDIDSGKTISDREDKWT